MEDKIKEALDTAGITEEQLTANGEAAKKAMEAKAEAAASKVEENKNPEVQEDGWDAKRIIKWTAITLGCVVVGVGAALLLKNREAVAEAAEATTEAAE